MNKKICPICNFNGASHQNNCPYCKIKLIDQCPRCRAPIKSSFAEYCYICGLNYRTYIEKTSSKKYL